MPALPPAVRVPHRSGQEQRLGACRPAARAASVARVTRASATTKGYQTFYVFAAAFRYYFTKLWETTFRSLPQRRARERAGTRTPNAQPTPGPALTYRMAESALATFVVFLFRWFVELMRLTLDFVCLVLFIGAHDPAEQPRPFCASSSHRSRNSRTSMCEPAGAVGGCSWQVQPEGAPGVCLTTSLR